MEIQDLARQIAEAQIDLRRVRYARHQFLTQASAEPHYDSRADVWKKTAVFGQFLGQNPPGASLEILEKFVTSVPKGPDKFATILSQQAKRSGPWIGMSAERCRDANLPFEPSMRRAYEAAIIETIESTANSAILPHTVIDPRRSGCSPQHDSSCYFVVRKLCNAVLEAMRLGPLGITSPLRWG